MNMPGFNAEITLYPSRGAYRVSMRFSGLSMGEVSMQQFRSPFFGRSFGTLLTCCKADDGTRPLFCRTRTVFPFEQCRCGQDFDGFPIFLCSPVATRG
jgi:hypothetical protein